MVPVSRTTLYNNHVLTKGLKPYPVCLLNRNGNMARFAGINIPYRAAFAGMGASHYFALVAVF